ncbi:hypothetical protein ACVST5_20795 [Yersinia enterocolitica]|uniref:hypothetical protein n=1 Tax=Yersinia TaxID=629 RepID=UPI0011A20FC6|nr:MULTISPECIES: hypothetical protein [Yersinia]MBW5833711.1 hypothetical protein [Yersinia enterocolitica]
MSTLLFIAKKNTCKHLAPFLPFVLSDGYLIFFGSFEVSASFSLRASVIFCGISLFVPFANVPLAPGATALFKSNFSNIKKHNANKIYTTSTQVVRDFLKRGIS